MKTMINIQKMTNINPNHKKMIKKKMKRKKKKKKRKLFPIAALISKKQFKIRM